MSERDNSMLILCHQAAILGVLMARRRHSACGATPRHLLSLLPVATVYTPTTNNALPQPESAAVKGFVRVLLVWVVLCAYQVSITVAVRVSVMVGLMPLVGIFHVIYLSIYTLESAGLIDIDFRGDLVRLVEGMDVMGNFIVPPPPAQQQQHPVARRNSVLRSQAFLFFWSARPVASGVGVG